MLHPPAAYQQVNGLNEYQDNAQGFQAVRDALVYWYQRALTILGPHPYLAERAWLQLQTADTILYNCGGIHTDGYGNYGRDYVADALYKNQIRASCQVTLPNGTLVRFTETGIYDKAVGRADQQGQRKFLQECHTFTANVGVYPYNVANPPPWAAEVYDINGKRLASIPGGVSYNIICNFHLYVGARFENTVKKPGSGSGITLSDFL